MTSTLVFKGLLVDSNYDWSPRIEEGVLVVQGERIVERGPVHLLNVVLEKYHLRDEDVIYLTDSQFLLPGLIDTHIHASQFPNAGLALDLTLLDWLEKYTFPTETRLGDLTMAEQVYQRCVKTTLSSGTTTACYFATIHKHSTEMLAKVCIKQGQRALIGKVCMDRNSPDNYCQTTETALSETRDIVESIHSLGSPLVRPVVTPRFVPTCSRELMTELGNLATRENLHIQTHLAENVREIAWVKELEPDCRNYTEVYHKSNLLGPKTVLAHCCHLEDEELELIKNTGAGVSHCPNSNFSLKSGVCDVRKYKNVGVKLGLGTDCSGGFSPSILNAMRMAVMASNTLTFGQPETAYQPLSYSDSLYLATRGGAAVLDMAGEVGGLDQGMLADILLVDMRGHQATTPFGHETPADLVHKFVFLADDRNIARVWVGGALVKEIKD